MLSGCHARYSQPASMHVLRRQHHACMQKMRRAAWSAPGYACAGRGDVCLTAATAFKVAGATVAVVTECTFDSPRRQVC
jgi:hypothetical protein